MPSSVSGRGAPGTAGIRCDDRLESSRGHTWGIHIASRRLLDLEIVMRKIALSLACLCLAAPAFAQNEQVVVSATRTEQPLDKTGESVSVITGSC